LSSTRIDLYGAQPATCKVNDGVDVYVAVERVKVRVDVKADDNVKFG